MPASAIQSREWPSQFVCGGFSFISTPKLPDGAFDPTKEYGRLLFYVYGQDAFKAAWLALLAESNAVVPKESWERVHIYALDDMIHMAWWRYDPVKES